MTAVLASGSSLYRGDVAGVLDAYASGQKDFIGMSILPPVMRPSKTDFFWKRDAGSLLKAPTGARAPGATYDRDDTNLSQDTYTCQEYGLEAVVDDSEVSLLSPWFDLAAKRGMDKTNEILRAQERRIAALLFNTSTWTLSGSTGLSITNEWDDTANATPVNDINTGKIAIYGLCGIEPDTLVLPDRNIRNLLKINAQIRASLGMIYNPSASGVAEVSDEMLAAALGVKRILVGGQKYNSTPGASSATLSNIWNPEYAFLCVTDPSPDLTAVCVGKTIAWAEDGGLMTVEQYREEQRRSDIIRVRNHVQEKVLLANCGFLFGNVTTI